MVPAGNKAKHLSSVNHTTKTIHHHHHHHQRSPHEIHNFREYHNVPLLLPIIWHISSSGMGQKALMKAKKYQWKKIHAKISTIILTHMLCVLLCKWQHLRKWEHCSQRTTRISLKITQNFHRNLLFFLLLLQCHHWRNFTSFSFAFHIISFLFILIFILLEMSVDNSLYSVWKQNQLLLQAGQSTWVLP